MLPRGHVMYVIRIRTSEGQVRIEAELSGHVTTAEALRAVSQGFALAEAGHTERSLWDVRAVTGGVEELEVIALSATIHLTPEARCALVCTPAQLVIARRFARATGIGRQLGVFTRVEPASQWLSASGGGMGRTERRHLEQTATSQVQAGANADAGVRTQAAG